VPLSGKYENNGRDGCRYGLDGIDLGRSDGQALPAVLASSGMPARNPRRLRRVRMGAPGSLMPGGGARAKHKRIGLGGGGTEVCQ
jgi:hypothetical protein